MHKIYLFRKNCFLHNKFVLPTEQINKNLSYPQDKNELYSKIKEYEKKLGAINKLTKWNEALRLIDEKQLKNKIAKFFILELDIRREDLFIQSYKAKDEEQATKEYSKLEKNIKIKRIMTLFLLV